MRESTIKRKSTETDINLKLNLDGKGKSNISTTIPFIDHMLTLFSKHSSIDLDIAATGDTQIDDHHTVEDLGICLGDAIKEALGDKAGIARYGCFSLPMDEVLADIALDISGRHYFVYNLKTEEKNIKDFDVQLIEEFLRAFSMRLAMTLHVNLRYGKNAHHVFEAVFKALAKAVKIAVKIEGGNGIPSSKGLID